MKNKINNRKKISDIYFDDETNIRDFNLIMDAWQRQHATFFYDSNGLLPEPKDDDKKETDEDESL